MKFSTRQQNSLALLCLTAASGSHAFSVPSQTPTHHSHQQLRQKLKQPRAVLVLRAAASSGDALSEVEALRAAAAKARAEADRLSEVRSTDSEADLPAPFIFVPHIIA